MPYVTLTLNLNLNLALTLKGDEQFDALSKVLLPMELKTLVRAKLSKRHMHLRAVSLPNAGSGIPAGAPLSMAGHANYEQEMKKKQGYVTTIYTARGRASKL